MNLFFFFCLALTISFYFLSNKYAAKKGKGYHHPNFAKKFYDTTKKKNIIYLISLFTRLVMPFFLFTYFHPCNAMILNQIVLDNIDPLFLVNVDSQDYDREKYQIWDKFLDLWGYLVALIPVFTTYKHHFASYYSGMPYILVGLLIYRAIGYLIFIFVSRKERLFIYFPDFYTALYYIISGCFMFNITNKYLISALIILSFYLKIHHEKSGHQD